MPTVVYGSLWLNLLLLSLFTLIYWLTLTFRLSSKRQLNIHILSLINLIFNLDSPVLRKVTITYCYFWLSGDALFYISLNQWCRLTFPHPLVHILFNRRVVSAQYSLFEPWSCKYDLWNYGGAKVELHFSYFSVLS